TDQATITRYWRVRPDYNIGIATGTASGIFVVDIDGAEAELRKLETEHGALPPTVEVITARGRHVYFQMPDGSDIRNSAGKVAPGIDVRANGGYVLAPPSVHPSGRRYAWSVDSASTFAAAPDWLLKKLASPSDGNGATPASAWRELIEGVSEGMRNESVARLTGH